MKKSCSKSCSTSVIASVIYARDPREHKAEKIESLVATSFANSLDHQLSQSSCASLSTRQSPRQSFKSSLTPLRDLQMNAVRTCGGVDLDDLIREFGKVDGMQAHIENLEKGLSGSTDVYSRQIGNDTLQSLIDATSPITGRDIWIKKLENYASRTPSQDPSLKL